MSTLAVLARQALGQPSGIRPHLAGRFEDATAGDGFDEVPATTTGFGQPVAAMAPATAPAATRSVMPAPFLPASAPSPVTVQAMPAVAGPVLQRKATTRAVDAAQPGDAVRHAPRSPAPSPADVPRAAPPPPGAAVQPATPAQPRDPERPVTNDPVRRPQPFTLLLPDIAVTAATPAQPMPSVPASHSNDVTVTIGRIEVRAAAPPRRPTAPARPRPPSRTMSLEDYLGGRSR